MSSEFWDRAARIDPMWAVLSDPAKRGRQWRTSEFFATGRREISLLLFQLSQLGHAPRFGDALDFGCGLGRLSQALAASFERVVGVDISGNMIRLAARLNRFPARVSYLLNDRPDLTRVDSASFDFVYSDIVLQHVPPDEARVYIAEFARVLRPGGIVVFQLPAEWRPPAARAAGPAAMPDEVYAAEMAARSRDPIALSPGAAADVVVQVTNASSAEWNQSVSGPIRVGNHWLSEDRTMLIQDDGRAALPERLAAGGTATLVVTVTAPREPGRYLCEFDLVHEGITWFADRGSKSMCLPVVVGSSAGASKGPHRETTVSPELEIEYPELDDQLTPPEAEVEVGEFPMHGIPAAEILALLEACGAECFHMEPDERGGPEWAGYRYFARRTPG
ncbi:MAG: class I SAM-dependent methyltransferase [Vicinamibacterales bacterium]